MTAEFSVDDIAMKAMLELSGLGHFPELYVSHCIDSVLHKTAMTGKFTPEQKQMTFEKVVKALESLGWAEHRKRCKHQSRCGHMKSGTTDRKG